MSFLIQGKTNWKYIIIVLILAGLVGGIVWYYYPKIPETEPLLTKPLKPKEVTTTKKIEAKEEMIKKIITEIIPSDFNKEKAEYYLEDLNNDGKPEIIIIVPDLSKEKEDIVAITLKDTEGNFEKIGELENKAIFRVIETEDLDNDNQKEIILSAPCDHHCYTEAILDVDFDNQKLEWLKLKNERGNIQEAFLDRWVGAFGSSDWDIEDIDKDGKKELVEIDSRIQFEKPENLKMVKIKQLWDDFLKKDYWKICETKVYEWDGSFFSYNEELSKTALEVKCAKY